MFGRFTKTKGRRLLSIAVAVTAFVVFVKLGWDTNLIFYAFVIGGVVFWLVPRLVRGAVHHAAALVDPRRGYGMASYLLAPPTAPHRYSVKEVDTEPTRAIVPATSATMAVYDEDDEDSEEPEYERGPRQAHLSATFNPPIDALIGLSVLVAGIKGSGKTNVGALLLEQIGKFGVLMAIFDVEGDYLSLIDVLPRTMCVIGGAPSSSDSYPQGQFVAVTLDNAQQIGAAILEQMWQFILDMPSYGPGVEGRELAVKIVIEIVKGMYAWADTHKAERVPCEIVIDEAQQLMPQDLSDAKVSRELAQDLINTFSSLGDTGRKRGFNPVVLTQRIARVNKKIITNAELLILMKQTSHVDLKMYSEYIPAWLAGDDDIRTLASGRGVVLPLFAEGGDPFLTTFDRRASRHVSTTPDLASVAKRRLEVEQRVSPVSPVRALKAPAAPYAQSPVFEPRTSAHMEAVRPPTTPTHGENVDVRYALSDAQSEQFTVAYRLLGNIDKALDFVGANSRYREHARRIIAERGLKKVEA